MKSSKDIETKGINAVLVLEMIGRPPEHMIETMQKLIKGMDEENGVVVKEKNIKEPVELKEEKGFYTTFAEVEVEVEQIQHLAILMFKYMPAHIEVVEPELIVLTNNGWGDILSELVRRLHAYEEVVRVLQMQNAQMQQKLKELMPEEKPKENKKETEKKGKKSEKK